MNDSVSLHSANQSPAEESWKRGVRVLGVSESFVRGDGTSTVVGVVMRGDYRIDGFGVCRPAVGGTDATSELLGMYRRIDRADIRVWLLGGGVISWFNVVDFHSLFDSTALPVVCVSYYPSEGIDKYLREYFPDDWAERVKILEGNGPRVMVQLKTGHIAFLNVVGMSVVGARKLLDQFTTDGRVPEPVRVARQLAAALRRDSGHAIGEHSS